MSAEATAYVLQLRSCPDGAELSCAHKCILFCLADHHNRSTRECMPSHDLLAAESLLSLDTVKRSMAYLERHAVLKRIRPSSQGRGQFTRWVFLSIDAPAELSHTLKQLAEGVQGAPLFTPPTQQQKGCNGHTKRGAEGMQRPHRNKEEPRTKNEPSTRGAKNAPRSPLLSQAERDSIDLKRWQSEMKKTEPQPGDYSSDPDRKWRARAKDAAFNSGVSPARLVELLLQHFPSDRNVPLLYPHLAEQPSSKRKRAIA